jgi:hypothetical protein
MTVRSLTVMIGRFYQNEQLNPAPVSTFIRKMNFLLPFPNKAK